MGGQPVAGYVPRRQATEVLEVGVQVVRSGEVRDRLPGESATAALAGAAECVIDLEESAVEVEQRQPGTRIVEDLPEPFLSLSLSLSLPPPVGWRELLHQRWVHR